MQHGWSCREFPCSWSKIVILYCDFLELEWRLFTIFCVSRCACWLLSIVTIYRCLQNVTIVIDSASCAADILIAGSLCVLLHRSRTGFRRYTWHIILVFYLCHSFLFCRTDTLINKLVSRFVIQWRLLTSILATLLRFSLSSTLEC